MGSLEGKMMVTLRSSDGEEFVGDESVARQSQIIRHMIEDGCADNTITLPNVTAGILSMIISYTKMHAEDVAMPQPPSDEEAEAAKVDLKKWDSDFMKIDTSTLYDLITACNYLEVKGLMDLCCQTVADMIKGKRLEEIRRTFNIENDFTPEEEEEIRRKDPWAFAAFK